METVSHHSPVTPDEPRWKPIEIEGMSCRRINLHHPEVGGRVVDEIQSDVDVYYDRRWGLTRRFCRFLVHRPELVEGLRVLVAGAGVGMEAVVVGKRAARVTVNDYAPVALDLQMEQLEENGVRNAGRFLGSFAEAPLEATDLVVACFVVYDVETRKAMARLLERTRERGIPVLLANEDIGGHFSDVLAGSARRIQELKPVDVDPDDEDDPARFVWIS